MKISLVAVSTALLFLTGADVASQTPPGPKKLSTPIATATPPLVTLSPPPSEHPTGLKKEADDSTPTLEETVVWLLGKLEKATAKREYNKNMQIFGSGYAVTRMQSTIQNFGIRECKMRFTQSDEGGLYAVDKNEEEKITHGTSSVTFEVRLSKIDPADLKVVALDSDTLATWVLTWENLDADDKTQSLKITSLTSQMGLVFPNKKDGREYIGFIFNDRELAKRVQKALQNAVVKCGGKAEPF